jgi:hypothetical protein
MTEHEYKIDRSGWPAGPWDKEPEDRVEWRSHGFPCLMARNRLGAWCGYVGVAEGHPWFEADYSGIVADAHGGLTYSGRCAGHICHVAQPGEPDEVWWLGFDTAHAADLVPGAHRYGCAFGCAFGCADYKSAAYVRMEVEALAAQSEAAAQEGIAS